jgi:4-hydroxythreonine-4-phosphate dehydrogenase
MLNSKQPIAITPGEPAGIGPDIVIKAVQQPLSMPVIIIADENLLRERAQQIGLSLPHHVSILHVPLKTPCLAGKPDPRNAAYVLETLRLAANGCLHHQYAAMVTGPVNKAVITQGGFAFTGHTDWLAQLLHVKQTVMAFAIEPNKLVALYSTHIPLAAVPAALSAASLQTSIEILQDHLKKYFAIASPCIGILGLNPHAGEEGLLGQEEISIITPVIKTLKKKGFDIMGPLAADTAFTPTCLKNYDALLAMYHDQALPAVKALGFGQAVNVTLGLPMIRTSVDHGTAFDLAGTGKADDSSLLNALRLTAKIIDSHA